MNKIIIIFFIFIYLVSCSYRFKFLQKFLIIFYLLEYLFIFLINNYYIYFLLICKYNNYLKTNLSNIFIINKIISKKKEQKKKDDYIDYILRVYHYRHMYIGFTVVYTQIFLRKIKEFKNYVIYMYWYKLKRIYNNFKKKIINYSLLFFFYNNYKLVFFLEKWKIKIFNFIVFFSFCKIYIKIYLLNWNIKKKFVNNIYLNKKNEKN
jgi:hypothetical protein